MNCRTTIAIAAALLCSAALAPAYAQSAAADHVIVTPNDIKWTAMPSLPCGAQLAMIEGPRNEAKPFTVRIKFPANCKIPPHYHPAIEHVTVISGASFGMGTGDTHDPAKGMTLPVGSVAIMQPQVHHYGWTTDETVVQLHGVGPWGITYVNPADDPAKKTN
jgi:quercetin dioxygenase-like cupin family protein